MENLVFSTRRGIKSDANEVARVYLAAYNVKTVQNAKEAYILEIKENHSFFIAFLGPKAIGFISWFMHGMPHHGLAELDRVAVIPEQRGKGVGKILFEHMILDAKAFYVAKGHKLRKVFLMTHDDNYRAQSFYLKMGMRREALLKNHYYDGRDEAVYSLFV